MDIERRSVTKRRALPAAQTRRYAFVGALSAAARAHLRSAADARCRTDSVGSAEVRVPSPGGASVRTRCAVSSMNPPPQFAVTSTASVQRAPWIAIALLWLAGNGLRLTILAVPPVIAMIRDDLRLSATEVGLLSSIPPAMFALAALAGSLLVARLGVTAALVGGLLLVATGSALRGASPGYAMLLSTTLVMSAGVAIMQPIMPTTVRQWLPDRIGLGTAVYTNGLLVGEILAVLLTTPLVLPLVGGSWRLSLVAWSVPIAIIAIVVYAFSPRAASTHPVHAALPRKWLPDWHIGLVWRLGALFCCVNAIYFSANAFIPIYLASRGRADLISGALLALNLGQLPASLLLLAVARRIEARAWPYLASGVLSLACVCGLVAMVGPATIVWAALLGFSDASALILGLTLPPLLCRPEDVARTSAGMFTLSYGGAVAVALASGAAWDLSGVPALAFLPIAACAIALTAVAGEMKRRRELT
jgi:CP family cyanate transporter-like MFS transporter